MNAIDGSLPRLMKMMAFGDWCYQNAHYLSAEIEVDPSAASRWVPSPLRLAKPAVATVFTAYFPINTFGSIYHEAGLFLHVTHRGAKALYCPWILVDDDVALILGRELLGYPKKMGEIEFMISNDEIRGIAARRGTELVRMNGLLKERLENPPPFLGRPHRNVRSTLGLALPKVLAFTPHEEPIEVHRVELEVKIGGSERDPLSELGFGRVLSAHLHRVNLAARGLPYPCGSVSPASFLKHWLLRAH
jgi:acetoacetate decarboxylase